MSRRGTRSWSIACSAPAPCSSARPTCLRDFGVALMLEAPGFPVDGDVRDRLAALGEFLRRQKAKVDERARPAIDPAEAWRVYVRLLRAATSDRQTDADFEKNEDLAQSLSPDDESYHGRATRAAVSSHP